MKVRYLIIILMVLASSCLQNNGKKDHSKHDEVVNVIEENHGIEAMEEDERNVPDISGRYDLLEGYQKSPNYEDEKQFKATVIIEKISEDEFGYYMAIKVHPNSPYSRHGILKYKADEFYSKVVSHENIPYFRLEHDIIVKDSLLGFTHKYSNVTDYQIFKKVNPDTEIYISLRKTLQSTKKDYLKLKEKYKEYNFDHVPSYITRRQDEDYYLYYDDEFLRKFD